MTDQDWGPVPEPAGTLEPAEPVEDLDLHQNEMRFLVLDKWRRRMQARGSPRWDWLRYLGLMPRRLGAGGLLLPSGTLWGCLSGRPPVRDYFDAGGTHQRLP